MGDGLGVSADTLKQGAKDIRTELGPLKKATFDGIGEKADAFGDENAAAALVTFCATWEKGASFLADCAETLASGLDAADGHYKHTDEEIRAAVKSVKTVLV